MAITAKEKRDLKITLKELGTYKGRHTELVTVYVPQGYDLNKIINHISQEQGTATNIKSTATRKNVVDALEKMLQHLKLFTKTPENGLAVFSGNVAEREGQSDVKVWSIEPPVPLNIRIYRCDKEFVLDPLLDMLETKEVYGLVVMDRREGQIALLKGKSIIPISETRSNVPGKTKAGGQCLMPSSLVQLSDGSLKKIKFVHNQDALKSMDLNRKLIEDSIVTDKWETKKTQIYKIHTKNPALELESSKDHLFFVFTNKGITTKAAEELKKGDYLIMPEKIEIKGRMQKIDSKQYHNSFTINKKGRELIIKKRRLQKLLQKELAKKLKLTQTAISFIELGKRNVSKSNLKNICNELDIDFNVFLKKYCSAYFYKEIRLPVTLSTSLARVLGYLIGDGSIEKDRISFFEQNEDVAFYYKSLAEKLFRTTLSYRFRQSKNYHQLRITSRPLVRLIKSIFPEIKKARNTMVPDLIMRSKDDVVAHFLKGLFDAEGYISGMKLGLSMNNNLLVRQTQMLLLRFGIICSVYEYDNKANPYSKNIRYSIQVSEKESLEKFNKYVGFISEEKSLRLANTIKNKSKTSYVRQIVVSGAEIRKIIEDIPIIPLKVNNIEVINKHASMVDISVKNESFIANGIFVHNSAARYMRIREDAAKDFYKKIAELMKEAYLGKEGLKGIIVGGPGPTKYDLVESGYITNDVKKKIIAIKDLSYTGPFGLQELLDRSQDVLASEELAYEKKAMLQFFETLAKTPELVGYGEEEVMKQLQVGAVATLLLSESLGDKKIDKFDEEAQKVGTTVKIISTETREGVQLRDIGKVGAILRYPVQV
ncbi:MAG: LAGLIDADG family homing endonuclease [Nanoarchaeota archaeon]|nr:LAGLIDADG family homing endonuclease [Nanoarchaeota archaeon]